MNTKQFIARVGIAGICAALSGGVAAQRLDPLLQVLGGLGGQPAARAAQPAVRGAQQAARMADRLDRDSTCAKISEWLAGVETLPQEVQQRRFGGARPGAAVATAAVQIPYESWLFEDSRFVPFFGQPFDALPADERDRLQRSGPGCQVPRNARGQAAADNMLLYRAFLPQYFNTYAQGVKSIRQARGEIDTAMKELPTLNPDEKGLERYRELAARAGQLSAFLGDAQRAEYKQALTSASQRVAVVNVEHARQAAAQARGYDGLLALAKLQADMFRDGGAAAAAGGELHARQAEIARELVAQERERSDALGSGPVGLERGVQWYREYQTRYEKLGASVPELREMLSYFEQRRGVVLDAAQGELAARIVQTRSEGELQTLVARYLPLEFDQRRASGAALLTRVAEWRDELQKRSVLGGSDTAIAAAQASRNVAEPLRRQTGAAAPMAPAAPQAARRPAAAAEPLAAGEPSESEMYDMVKHKFDDAAAEMRNMAQACNGGFSNNDPGKAILCLAGAMGKSAGAGEAMKITRFEKLGCERASGKPGYVCDYLIATSGGVSRAMGPSMAAIAGRSGAAQARFLKTRDGWLAWWGENDRR